MGGNDDEPTARWDLTRVRVTGFACALAFCLGTAMAYVPHRFSTPAYVEIYDDIRLIGLALLFGAGLVVFAAVTPQASRPLRVLGQLVLAAAIGFLLLHFVRLGRGWTGPVFYGLVVLFLLLEAALGARTRRLFAALLVIGAALLGATLLFGVVSPSLTQSMPGPLLIGSALLFLGGAAGVLATWRAPGAPLQRLALFGCVLAFGVLAVGFGLGGVWTGLVSYVVCALTCAWLACAPRLDQAPSVRRGALLVACIAGLLPLLALGAVATWLAQAAITDEVALRVRVAADSSAEQLRAHLVGAPRSELDAIWLARLESDGVLDGLGPALPNTHVFLVERGTDALLTARSSDGTSPVARLLGARGALKPGVTPSPAGVPLFVARAPVPGTSIDVVVTEELATVLAPVSQLGASVLGFLVLAFGLGLALARPLSRRLSESILEVARAMRVVADGRLDARVAPQRLAELHELVRAFNRMAERTEATQTELVQLSEDLSTALRARDRFLGMAAHELRSPLASLDLSREALSRRLAREERAEGDRVLASLDVMKRQLRRLSTLVNDLVDSSRIGRGGALSMQRGPTDVREGVKDAVEQTLAGDAAGQIALSLCEVPAVANADPARLVQVWLNLLQNARRYSPKGAPVRVAVTADADGVEVSVEDEGVGLDEDAKEQIFDPFLRMSDAPGGMGLGLFICREIVAGHDGRIWAESGGPGRGSRFRVWLPACPGA